MICYKLTDQDMRTRGGFQYTLGEWTPALSGEGRLCTKHWYHVYDSQLVATMLNPSHANISEPRFFKATYDGRCHSLDSRGLKRGVTRLRLDEELEAPALSSRQRVRAAICCVCELYHEPTWSSWAKNWLDGTDRTFDGAVEFFGAIAITGDRARAAKQAATAAIQASADYNDSRKPLIARFASSAIAYVAVCEEVASKKWGDIIERAIADENKFQEEKTT